MNVFLGIIGPDLNDRIEILSIIEAEATNSTINGFTPQGNQPNSQEPCN